MARTGAHVDENVRVGQEVPPLRLVRPIPPRRVPAGVSIRVVHGDRKLFAFGPEALGDLGPEGLMAGDVTAVAKLPV